MDLYQVCSNYLPGAKNCPASLGSRFTWAYMGKKHGKIFSETIQPRALIFRDLEHFSLFQHSMLISFDCFYKHCIC